MKTPEILEAAAGVIERNGWARGEYYLAVLDTPRRREKDPRTCEVCPRGAIAVAVGRHPLFVADWPEYCEARDATGPAQIAELAQAEQADRAAIIAAEEALIRHLLDVAGYRPPRKASSAGVIECWADEEGRTLEQVLAALAEAARAELGAGR